MDAFRFADPWALVLLAALPMLAVLTWPRAVRLPAVRMGSLAAAAQAPLTWRVRLEPMLLGVRLAAIALIIMAIARPQRGEAAVETQGEGIDIVLAFDVSSSMTQQFGPGETRMEAAKEVLSEFALARDGDRVALVAFQGSSLTLSPLTTDYAAIAQAVQGADRLTLADGTAIGTALGESVNVLRGSTAASRIVILMTDGENNAGALQPLAAARIAERLGVRVYTVGVLGSPFGRTPGQSTLNVDEESLRSIADVTGGDYSPAEDRPALVNVYDRIARLETSRVGGRTFTRFDEIAPYFLAAAACALALEVALRATYFRRAA